MAIIDAMSPRHRARCLAQPGAGAFPSAFTAAMKKIPPGTKPARSSRQIQFAGPASHTAECQKQKQSWRDWRGKRRSSRIPRTGYGWLAGMHQGGQAQNHTIRILRSCPYAPLHVPHSFPADSLCHTARFEPSDVATCTVLAVVMKVSVLPCRKIHTRKPKFPYANKVSFFRAFVEEEMAWVVCAIARQFTHPEKRLCRISKLKSERCRLRHGPFTLDGLVLPTHKIGRQTTCHRSRAS